MINLFGELFSAWITVLLLFADEPLYFFANIPACFWFLFIYFSNASFLSLITLNLYKSDFLILQ